MRNKGVYLFLFLLCIGVVVRLYKFSNPIADWHSWRQADTSSVSRNLIASGFDILHPTYHDLSNVPSGEDNPNGYRFVEFPIYNVLQSGSFVIIDFFTLEEWGRLVTIASSLLSSTFLYLLVRKYAGQIAALFTAFFYLFLPFSIYFGRVILPDPSMTASFLGAIFFFDKWLEGKSNGNHHTSKRQFAIKSVLYFTLSLLFSASALLLKPFAAFFLLPIAYLSLSHFGIRAVINWKLWVFAILSLLPLLWWRQWMQQFPEGIPVNDWLFNDGNIRFKGAYFYWLFADRIGRLILGYWGIPLFVLGVLTASRHELFSNWKKPAWFFYSFLLGSLIYLIVIARGNVQHDYYQIPVLPSIVIFAGLGAGFLFNLPKEIGNRIIGRMVLLVCTGFSLLFGWYFVRDFFNINNPNIITAGKAVDELTPKDAKVIALYEGDTSFLYQTNRRGWTSLTYELPKMIEKGADYLVIVNPSESDREGFGTTYSTIQSTNEYLLLKLK